MSLFRNAHFIASAHEQAELPPDIGHEVAFAGRSNAGKSSAINAITARRKLAFVSKTPGRTQTINFFDLERGRRLVDLPGYGYAAVSQRERAHWATLVSGYLQRRGSLKGLVVIADSRHALKALDMQLIGWYAPSGLPLLVLLTKCDKLRQGEAAASLKRARADLARVYPQGEIQLFSATAGTGVPAAQGILYGWLK
ncbi:MAG: ribosome biogenesis GTP-binding protein YihA/YsxC [Burkholderiales bacterium]